ncbi:MAG: hypothetical protein V2I63_05775 [Pseudomonadales bacterium]|jgi:tetratricopeptide (TPR) repeat protein|nr:hypothetical protein [Pseudomonadales bacterium]
MFERIAIAWIIGLAWSLPVAAEHAMPGMGTEPAPAADGTPGFLTPIDYVPEALGPYSWPITTTSAQAQALFDQGMQLRWGYNVDDAARSMASARRADPECAMCWWGEAFALGSFLNGGMSSEKAPYAHSAIMRAMALREGVTPVERALIEAAAVRYPADYDPEQRRPVDQAFADAMARVYADWPDHHEVATVYAVSLFLLEPRRGTRDVEDPNVKRLHAVLTGVLDEDIRHPGACHLYIHATESSQHPEWALPCAEYLGTAVPIASHVQHMPSHSWNEVGAWGRSVRANIAAWHSDQKSMEQGLGFSYAPMHNLHMLLFAASFDGQGGIATQAGRDYRKLTGSSVFEALTLARFGRFDEVVAVTDRPDDIVEGAMWDFAQGYARVRSGEVDAARPFLERVQGVAKANEGSFRFHEPRELIGTLAALLEGEVRWSEGDLDEAIEAFQHAVVLEDALGYDEPEPLPFAARHWLGAALLAAKRPADAEIVYRAELADHPHNGWSLFGLRRALAEQGRVDPLVEADFEESWARADALLTGSRY